MAERMVILGGGESGIGAAILAKKQGYEVFLSDGGTIQQKYKDELLQYDIPFEEGKHSLCDLPEGFHMASEKDTGDSDRLLLSAVSDRMVV